MKKGVLKWGLTAIVFSLCGVLLHSQVDVSATGGTANATYTTLNDAFTAINSGTHQGSIVISITGNTTEPAAVALSASGQGTSSYTSITIKPTVTAVISGAPAAGHGIIELNGSDNVTIDGSIAPGGTTRDLTFLNTAAITVANTTAIRLIGITTAGLGTNNVSIRNCIIAGNTPGNSGSSGSTVTSSYCIYAGSSSTTTLSTSGTGANYDNLTIENNLFRSAYYAIYVAGGASPDQNDNLIIRGNTIGSSTPTEQVSLRGIYVSQTVNGQITDNTISDLKLTASATVMAIEVAGSATTNLQISRNRISGIYSQATGGYGANGIMVGAGTGTLIVNNVIYDIRTMNYNSTTTTAQAFGIRLGGGTGHKVYYNSVHLYGDYTTGSTAFGRSAALGVSATSVTGIDIRNNILSNKMTSNATAKEFLAIWFPASYDFSNAIVDHNAYMVTADAFHFIGKVGTTAGSGNYATLSNWRTISQVNNTSNDVNSVPTGINSEPPFTADNDLTIPAGTSTPIESGGVVISSLGIPNTDFTGANRPAGAGTDPDIGAYEFAGMAVTADVGITQLVRPLTAGCHGTADSVVVRLQNFISDPIDFTTDPVTITAFTTGANPVSFPPVVINTGSLAGNTAMDVVVSTTYNFSAAGTHTFHAYADLTADNVATNDTLAPVSINISGGTATTSAIDICNGSSASLSLSGQTSGATFQWQESADGSSWTNVTGGTTSPFNVSPSDTMYYRALVCGVHTSVVDTVNVISLQNPTVANVARCGPGVATLTGTVPSPATSINWYTSASGGFPMHSGLSFTTPFLNANQTYYVSSTNGSLQGYTVGYINSVNYNFLTQTNGWGAMFTVHMPCTFDSVGVYPTGTGTISIEILDPSNNVLYTGPTVNISGNGTQKVMVPVGASLTPGNYKLGQNTTGVSNLGSEPTGNTFAYPFVSVPLTITSGSQGTGAVMAVYYWFYDWRVSTSTGCESPRIPVTVTITPSDSIFANAVTNPLCENLTTPVTITSANPDYQYTWSPATGLNTTTGDSVVTDVDSTVTYTIHALDTATDCAANTSITVNVTRIPQVSVTPADSVLCMNQTVQVLTDATGSDPNVIVGNGTSSNSATTTTILGPYGGVYGGTRQQYLYTASELTAAGLTAGPIDFLEFEVTNLNSVGPLSGYTIRMDTTSAAVLTATFITGLPIVYNSSSYMPVNGWNHHPVSVLNWNGTSNIVVEICFNNNNAGYASGNASVRYTSTTGTNTMTYFRADNDPNVCATTSGTVSVNRPNCRFGHAAPLTYQWSPVLGLSSSTIGNPVLTAVATNDYIVSVTDQLNGCVTADTMSVFVNPIPPVNIGNDTTLCTNGTGFFLDATAPGISYMWQDSSTSPTYLVTEDGLYHVTVTDANNCYNSDSVTVTLVNPVPVDIDISVTSTTTATLDAGSGYASYLWHNFNTSQSINVTGNGVYYVTVTDMNGCVNSDTVNLIFQLDVLNPDGSEVELTYYPNPSQGIVNFSLQGLKADRMQLDIMDMSGKKVFARSYENISASMADQLDLTYLSGGTYIVRLTTENGTYMNRIVITKP